MTTVSLKDDQDDVGADLAKQKRETINKYDPEKKEKLDLVNGSRPRCVETDILPPKHVVTAMEQLFKEKQERDKANYFLKQGLGGGDSIDAARGTRPSTNTYIHTLHTYIHT